MPQFETSTYIGQFFWLILCFISLWLIMSWFIVPRIDDIVEQRRHKIDGYIQKAEKTNKLALQSLEKYENALKKAKDEAEKAINENNNALSAELSKQREENQKILMQKINDNENDLKNLRQEALAAVDEMSFALALDILHKSGFESVTAEQLKPYVKKE